MLRETTNRIAFCLLLVLAADSALCPSDVKAGTFTLTSRYVGSFDAQNNSLGMLDLSQPQDATVVHQFDFNVELADMAAGENFGAVAFNIDLGPGVSQALGGWQADDSTYDVSNPFGSTTKPLWSGNGDAGASSSDFQAIWSSMNATSAKATNFGDSEDGLTRLGSIFVNWDGSSDGRIDISPIAGSSMAIFTEDKDGMATFKAIADGFRSGGFQFGENAGQTAAVDYVPPVRRPMPIIEEPITPEPAIPEVVDPVVVLPPVVDPIIIVPEVIVPVVDPIVIPPVVTDPIGALPEVISPEPPAPIDVDPILELPIIVHPLPADPIDIGPLMPEVPIRQPVVDLPDPIIDDPIIADPIDTLPKIIEPVVAEPVDEGPFQIPPFADDPLSIPPIHADYADEDEDVRRELLFPMIPAIEYPRIDYRWFDENGRTREGFRYPGMDDVRDDMPLIITFADSARLAGTATPFAASGPALPEPSTIALVWSGIFLLLSGHRRRRNR